MSSRSAGLWRPVVKVLGVTLALVWATHFLGVRDLLHLDSLRQHVALAGWKGVAVVLVAGAVTPVAFVPRWPIGVLCGLVYGVEYGVVVASLGGLLGAAVHYRLTALLVSSRERALLESCPWFQALQASSRPFLAIVALRLFPFSNFSATNLVCGLLRIPFGCYLGASFLGMLPSTVVFVMAGKGVSESDTWLVGTALTVAAALALIPVFRGVLRGRAGVQERLRMGGEP